MYGRMHMEFTILALSSGIEISFIETAIYSALATRFIVIRNNVINPSSTPYTDFCSHSRYMRVAPSSYRIRKTDERNPNNISQYIKRLQVHLAEQIFAQYWAQLRRTRPWCGSNCGILVFDRADFLRTKDRAFVACA